MDSAKYSHIPPPSSPPEHHHPPPENYVVLPFFYSPGSRLLRRITHPISLLLLGSLSLSLYVLWPSDPDLEIVRLRLQHLRVHTRPRLSVDVSVAATVKVRNRDAYSVDFDGLNMAISYRGKELGHVTSREGHVRSWGSSYVETVAEFSGVDVFSDWIYLLDDLLKGTVSFDTVSTVNGRVGLLFFELPLKSKMSCAIDVDVKNQAIARQSCYSE